MSLKMTNTDLHQRPFLVHLVTSDAFQVWTNWAAKTWWSSKPNVLREVGDLLVLSDWLGVNFNFKGMYAVI